MTSLDTSVFNKKLSGLPPVFSDGSVEVVDDSHLPRGVVDPDAILLKKGLPVAGYQKGYDCSKIRGRHGN